MTDEEYKKVAREVVDDLRGYIASSTVKNPLTMIDDYVGTYLGALSRFRSVFDACHDEAHSTRPARPTRGRRLPLLLPSFRSCGLVLDCTSMGMRRQFRTVKGKKALTDFIMNFLKSRAQYTYTVGRGTVEVAVEEFLRDRREK